MSVNVTEYESTLGHDGLRIRILPLHWLKKWMTSTTMTTRLGRRTHHEHIFLRVMTSGHIMWWGYQPPRVWRRGHASQSSHHQLSQLAHRWHRKLWSECASILHWCTSCSSPELIFCYEHDIKLHNYCSSCWKNWLAWLQHVHCRWQGQNVVLINRESDSSSVELCSPPPTGISFIGNVHICHLKVAIWKVVFLESPLNMNSKMARILTTRVSCVHEQYHLIHFRHLQIYYSSPTTSARNLDVGLQAAVPSYDARYFVYERMAKQGIIHWHEISLKEKSLTI